MRTVLSLIFVGALTGCTVPPPQTAQVPDASLAEYQMRLASLPAYDPLYQSILNRLRDPARTPQTVETDRILARAYLTRGQAFNRQQPINTKGAAADFRLIVDQFGGASDPEVIIIAARAFLELGQIRPRLAEGGDPVAERRGLYTRALGLLETQKSDAADEITSQALYLQGISLLQDQPIQRTEGLAILDDLVTRFRSSKSVFIQQNTLAARNDAAQIIANRNPPDYPKSVALADDALILVKDTSVANKDYHMANALLQKGYSLYRLGRETEALVIAEQVMRDFGKSTDLPTRRVVSRVALNVAYAHGYASPRRTDAQRAAVRDLVARFGADTDAVLVERVAEALDIEGDSLISSTPPRHEDALDSYLAAHRRLGNLAPMQAIGTRFEVAVDLGRTYARLRRADEAMKYLDLADKLAVSFPNDVVPFRKARSLSQRIISLADLGNEKKADILPTLEKLAIMTAGTQSPAVIREHLLAFERYLRLIIDTPQADWKGVLAEIDRLIQRYGDFRDKQIEENIAWLYFNQGFALKKLDRVNDATAVWDQLVTRFEAAKDPDTAYPVARALYEKALAMRDSRPAIAREALQTLLQRYETSTVPRMPALVQNAHQQLKQLSQPASG